MSQFLVYVDSNNRNQSLYPNSNAFTLFLTQPIKNITKVEVLSALLPNVFSSQFVTLDILELRTPFNLTADQLVITAQYPTGIKSNVNISNLTMPSANAFYGSFATIPIKASSSVLTNLGVLPVANIINNNQFYNSDYRIEIDYPSLIDKLDRLTISWRQPNNGDIFIDKNFNPPIDLGRNMTLIRFTTVDVPVEPERPDSLPPPVPFDNSESNMKMYVVLSVMAAGLLIILLMRPKK
jgi:hypothetical protein